MRSSKVPKESTGHSAELPQASESDQIMRPVRHEHGVARKSKNKKKVNKRGTITALEDEANLKITGSEAVRRDRPFGTFHYNTNGEPPQNVALEDTCDNDRPQQNSGTTESSAIIPRRDISLTDVSPASKRLVTSRPPLPHPENNVITVNLSQAVLPTVNKQSGDAIGYDSVIDVVEAQEVKRESFFQNKKKACLLLAAVITLMCAVVIGLSVVLLQKSRPTPKSIPSPLTDMFSQVTKPLDGPEGSAYGSSVSICGDGSRVAIAGPGEALVQVFQLSKDGGSVQVGQNISLSKFGGINASKFVRTKLVVELSNNCNVLAIGEPYGSSGHWGAAAANNKINEGRVTLFEFVQGAWVPLGTPNVITGYASQDYAGTSVSLSHDGGIVAIGSPGFGTNIGHVRVFLLNGGMWNQLGTNINGAHDNQAFGVSVSLSSKDNIDMVAIGSSTGIGSSNAAVDVYEFRTGNWKNRGSKVLVDRETLLAGVEMSWMVQLSWDGKRLVTSNLYLENRVTHDNNGLLVKAYEFAEETQTWTQLGKNLHQNYPGAKSGYIVSLSRDGTRMGMGDPGSELVGGLTGHAHFYELIDGEKWCQIGPNIDGDAPGDMAGFSISLSGDGEWLVIGSPFSRARGRAHGRVGIWNVNRQHVIPDCNV